MEGLRLKYLEWDTEQLGVSSGLIDGTKYENLPKSEDLTCLIEKLIEQEKTIRFITIKLHQNYLKTVNALIIRLGAVLLDTELTFAYLEKPPRNIYNLPENYKIEFCKKIHSQPFLELAKEMKFSRFFLDPHIPNNIAMELWKQSIRNHCEGFADQLLIAFYNNEPIGMITLKFTKTRQIFLHIVGVLQKHQGKGLGKLMLSKIIEKYASDYQIYVETQSMNLPAQIVYQKAGFFYHSLKYVLHYWRD